MYVMEQVLSKLSRSPLRRYPFEWGTQWCWKLRKSQGWPRKTSLLCGFAHHLATPLCTVQTNHDSPPDFVSRREVAHPRENTLGVMYRKQTHFGYERCPFLSPTSAQARSGCESCRTWPQSKTQRRPGRAPGYSQHQSEQRGSTGQDWGRCHRGGSTNQKMLRMVQNGEQLRQLWKLNELNSECSEVRNIRPLG